MYYRLLCFLGRQNPVAGIKGGKLGISTRKTPLSVILEERGKGGKSRKIRRANRLSSTKKVHSPKSRDLWGRDDDDSVQRFKGSNEKRKWSEEKNQLLVKALGEGEAYPYSRIERSSLVSRKIKMQSHKRKKEIHLVKRSSCRWGEVKIGGGDYRIVRR